MILPSAFATAYSLVSLLPTVQGSPVQQRSPDDVPDGYYVPMYYPAPFGGWVDSWAQSYEKARDLVDQMTLAEKTNITAGTGIFMGRFHVQIQAPILTPSRVSFVVCRFRMFKQLT
jgi:hypothetical protein